MSRVARLLVALSVSLGLTTLGARTLAQDLGHRILGTLGLQAGNAPAPGVYVLDRFAYYGAQRVFDGYGRPLPIQGLDLDVYADALGAAFTERIPQTAMTYTLAAGFPIAQVSLNSDQPLVSIDRFGVGDVFVQPLKLGIRLANLDAVASYAVYVPTGLYDRRGGSGVSTGQFTNEFSLGGTLFFDRARTVYLSLLGSYDAYGQKRGVDITRGDTFQVQGGAGVRLFRIVDVGLAAYALWQLRDDRGADLPVALRGVREHDFGLGPEIDVLLAPIRAQLGVRYEHDIDVQGRPEGQVFVCSLNWLAGRAAPPRVQTR